jgi:replicative DNA helicase
MRQKKTVDISSFGKVPPQAREFEEAVLGAILLEKSAFDRAIEILKPEMFYVDANQRVFKAMVELSNNSHPIDILTVSERLKTTEELDIVGGMYQLMRFTNSVVSSAHIEDHALTIYKKYLKREQIRICGEGLSAGYEDNTDAFDILDELQSKVGQLATAKVQSDIEPLTNSLIETFQRIETLRHREDHLTGVPSGFKPIDLLTAGWQDTDLIIIAARPSVGKTAFALNLARNAAASQTKPTPVAIFSLEMSKGQLNARMLSSESGIELDKITRARLTESEMQRLYTTGVQPLGRYDLSIDDTPALNIFDLKAKCRKWLGKALKRSEERKQRDKLEGGRGLIIIDYLQLMSGITEEKVKNREQEIANISRSLKGLAKELKIPIIALSQLSRDLEKQKRDPQLSDLRESGSIEQDADMVMFLTRPDYQQTDMVDESVMDYADIHIKKHRNGDLAKIPMRTVLSVQRWMSDEQYREYQINKNSNYKNLIPISSLKNTGTDGDYF